MNLNTAKHLFDVMRLSHRSRAEIENFQIQKLRQLLIYAKANVPYYRRLYDAIDLNAINSLEDLHILPRLTQNQIRSTDPDLLLDEGMVKSNMLSFTTSGTSSKPSTHYISKKENEIRQIKTLRSMIELGWRPWWTMVSIYRFLEQKKYSWIQRIINGKRFIVSINQPAEKQFEELKKYKPTIIHGLTSCVEVVADYLIATNQQYKPKVLLTAGEVKPEKTGEKFLKAFGQRGYQRYGAVECGIMAYPCKGSSDMYIDEDSYILEVLDANDKPVTTGSGRVVITTLDQLSFPLIRYEIGDMLTFSKVPDNSKNRYKRIKSIDGRIANTITLKNGQVMPYQVALEMYTRLDAISRFQFLHDQAQNVLFCYVKKENQNDETIKEEVLKYLKIPTGVIEFKSCSQIKAEKSGKFSWVKKVSNVKEFY